MTDRPSSHNAPNDADAARWRRLSAFVDGELGAREAAETAQQIADDPNAAREAAQLASAKEALGQAIAAPALSVPSATPGLRRRARLRRWAAGLGALAASAAVAVGLTLAPPAEAPASPDWAQAAAAQHAELSRLPQPIDAAAPRLERTTIAGFAPFVPSLEAARLRILAHIGFDGPDGAPGLAVHYRGARGCRVTLIALRDGAKGVSEALSPLAHAQGYIWRVGAVRYQLLASGMDKRRFAAVAQAAHEASRLHQPTPADTRLRLAQARAESQPCRV
ncbi:MAG: hypothetical protein RIB45_11000 [Marivibrio sp.]|uniref:hypothetical protein n=1 Tax=Marivibrio sp. TaxID=2039719 RepID=UPI0032ED16FE